MNKQEYEKWFKIIDIALISVIFSEIISRLIFDDFFNLISDTEIMTVLLIVTRSVFLFYIVLRLIFFFRYRKKSEDKANTTENNIPSPRPIKPSPSTKDMPENFEVFIKNVIEEFNKRREITRTTINPKIEQLKDLLEKVATENKADSVLKDLDQARANWDYMAYNYLPNIDILKENQQKFLSLIAKNPVLVVNSCAEQFYKQWADNVKGYVMWYADNINAIQKGKPTKAFSVLQNMSNTTF